jgi:RNA-dependent RNA polymerase
MGDFKGSPNWYGGRIQQRANLVKDGEAYKLVLVKPELGGRSRDTLRLLSSRRLIQVRLASVNVWTEFQEIHGFFLQKQIILGRVFVALHYKEGSVWLVETEENFERKSSPQQNDNLRLSLESLIFALNPPDLNGNQVRSS